MKAITERNVALIVLTVYRPVFLGNWPLQLLANLGIYFIDSAILAECKKVNVPAIDLRTVFDKPEDYANSIEPGVPGGDKICRNILQIIDNKNLNKFGVFTDRTYSPGVSAHGHSYWQRRRFEQEGPNEYFRRAISAASKRIPNGVQFAIGVSLAALPMMMMYHWLF